MNNYAARLPESLLDTETIEHMKAGETAYTVFWAMTVDGTGRCFLNARYPAHPAPFGTANMRIERRKEGFHVFVPPGQKWHKTKGIPWVGASPEDWIPVFEIHT